MTWKRIHRALKPYYIFAVLLALWFCPRYGPGRGLAQRH